MDAGMFARPRRMEGWGKVQGREICRIVDLGSKINVGLVRNWCESAFLNSLVSGFR